MTNLKRRAVGSIVFGMVLMLSSFYPAQILAQSATPVDLGCTIWRTGADSPTTPKECSSSAPWWESWSDCAMTPVHNEPWKGDPGLNGLPWIPVDMGSVQATAHLFFGNRPLPIGDTFPNDKMHTKVLWTFDHDVRNFTVTATIRDDASFKDVTAAETGPANTNTDSSRSWPWPSYVSVPAAGCWDFTLNAEDIETGKAVSGKFTFIAVK